MFDPPTGDFIEPFQNVWGFAVGLNRVELS